MALTITRRGILIVGSAAIATTAYRVSSSSAEADPFEAARANTSLAHNERFELGWILREHHPRLARYVVRTDSDAADFIRCTAVQSHSGISPVRGCRALIVASEQGPKTQRYYFPTRVIDFLAHDDPRSIAAREQAVVDAERNAVWREYKVEGSCRWRSLTTTRGRYESFHFNDCEMPEPYQYAANGSRVWVQTGTSWDGANAFAVSDRRPIGISPETGPERKSRLEELRKRRAGRAMTDGEFVLQQRSSV